MARFLGASSYYTVYFAFIKRDSKIWLDCSSRTCFDKNPRVTLLDTPDLLSWFLGHTEFPSTYSTEPVTNHTQNSVGMTLRRFARTATLNMSFSRLCSAYIRPEHLVIGHNSMLRGYAKISEKTT